MISLQLEPFEDGFDHRTNPHHQARVIEGLAKLTNFLTEIGVITDHTRPEWQDLGLICT